MPNFAVPRILETPKIAVNSRQNYRKSRQFRGEICQIGDYFAVIFWNFANFAVFLKIQGYFADYLKINLVKFKVDEMA